jgi:hypothetical protein
MSDRLDVYEHTSHWIKPVPSTFKVARQFGQNGHVMVPLVSIQLVFAFLLAVSKLLNVPTARRKDEALFVGL